MYYKVFEYIPGTTEVTWEDMLFNFDGKDILHRTQNTTNRTVTREYETMPDQFYDRDAVYNMINWLHSFNERHSDLFNVSRESLYHSYRIPKKSGGLRPIDEPLPPLMEPLRELIAELQRWGIFHHTAAYAYIKKRWTKDAMEIHQRFKSNYYLKTDLKNFFGSTTLEFTMKQVSKIVPFCFIARDIVIDAATGEKIEGKTELEKALSLAFFHGGLPQGTPISPFLTNLIMIPIDHDLAGIFSGRKMVYTRYADDMQISARENFQIGPMVNIIRAEFAKMEAPYEINEKKTEYRSRKGSNFNLGLCTNADNNITVGHEKKKLFKAMVNNLILDTVNGKRWDIDDVQHVNGLLSYYRSVEQDYFDAMINKYNRKYNVNFRDIIKSYFN